MLKQLSLLYSSAERIVQLMHANSEELSQFAKTLEHLRVVQERRYRDDRYIQDILTLLRSVFYKYCSSLLPYNQIIDSERQTEIRMKLAQLKHLYPELFTQAIVPLARALKQIFETNRNCIAEEISRLIQNTCSAEIAIVSKKSCTPFEQSELIKNLKSTSNITFYSESSFRCSIESYSEVIFIGTPAYYGAWASECLKADTTFFISYDIFTNKVEANSIFPKHLPKGQLVSTIGKHIKYSDTLQKSLSISIEHLQHNAKDAVQRILSEQVDSGATNIQPVEASIVYFESERFTFVTKDSKIRTFTPNMGKDFVKQILFHDLEEDKFIIIRNERDSKLIAEVADQEILKSDAPHLRAMQEEWKQQLNILVDQKGVTRSSLYLSNSHGMTTASPASVRIWCGEESICPKELPLLLKVLGYSQEQISKVHSAMKRIQTAHIAAGRHISVKLMSELTSDISGELLEKGWHTFTSKQLNGASFNIERVVAIDHSKHSVMPYNLMKLFGLND